MTQDKKKENNLLFWAITGLLTISAVFLLSRIIILSGPGKEPAGSNNPDLVARRFLEYYMAGDKRSLKSLSTDRLGQSLDACSIEPELKNFPKDRIQQMFTAKSDNRGPSSSYRTAYELRYGEINRGIGLYLTGTPSGWKVYRIKIMDMKYPDKITVIPPETKESGPELPPHIPHPIMPHNVITPR